MIQHTRWLTESLTSGRSLCAAGLLAAFGLTADLGHAATDAALLEAGRTIVNQALGLRDSQLIEMAVDGSIPGRAVVVPFVADGRTLTLELQPHTVRSPDYQVFAVDGAGNMTPVEPAPVRTLRGTVAEVPGAAVRGSLMPEGLYASVRLPQAGTYWIEPVGDAFPLGGPEMHVVYHERDLLPTGFECGTDHQAIGHEAARLVGIDPQTLGTSVCTTELACDADFPYYQDWGSNTTTVQNRINAVIDAVNNQYESEVGITHVISTILIRTSSTYTTNDAFSLLSQFRNRWLSNHSDIPRDCAHLFTGRNLSGSTLGIAWDIGAICTTNAYCLSESDWTGSFACVTDVTAHELGHLWGAFHCTCPSFTMNPGITCANQFSNGSINSIVAHRNSRNCIDCGAPAYCTAGSDDTTDEFIQRVTIGAIDNASGRASYTDFTSISTEVERGDSEPITVINGEAFTGDQCRVWVDWNQDLDFSDVGEEYVLGPGPTTFNGTITVPMLALFGSTRMRIRVNYTDTSTPCGSVSWGEVEDYTIVITPPPSGACCFPTFGGCVTQTEANCIAAGGIFQGLGTDCSVCPTEPFGACCIAGDCSLQTEADCLLAGGTYQGNGVLCDAGTCTVAMGACCNAGNCTFETEADCLAQGGTYEGDDVLCSQVSCPLPMGACCNAGNCTFETEANCLAQGGTYEGDDVLCSQVSCPLPMGACCNAGNCTIETQADCIAQGGTYEGDDVLCSQVTCPLPMGACCNAGDCTFETQADCVAQGGVYQGDDMLCSQVSCPDPMGACCNAGDCTFVTEASCIAQGGTYEGDDVLCSQVTCPDPMGACCNAGNCTFETEADCLAQGGTYEGDDVLCSQVTCPDPMGACCNAGNCTLETEADCLAQGGTYEGNDVLCSQVTCPDPTGACCNLGNCTIETEADCIAQGGTYEGNDVLCSQVTCPDPMGACCNLGNCTIETEADCIAQGGTYEGNDVLCSQVTCPQPTGACCNAGNCTIETEAACLAQGGTYEGNDVLCSQVTCPQPMGACCNAGNCTIETEADCLAQGGTYEGNDVQCAPMTCAIPCPEDLDGDLVVGFTDLTQLLAAWGSCPGCAEDLDGDMEVGFTDLTQLLAGWGPC